MQKKYFFLKHCFQHWISHLWLLSKLLISAGKLNTFQKISVFVYNFVPMQAFIQTSTTPEYTEPMYASYFSHHLRRQLEKGKRTRMCLYVTVYTLTVGKHQPQVPLKPNMCKFQNPHFRHIHSVRGYGFILQHSLCNAYYHTCHIVPESYKMCLFQHSG